MLEELVVTPKGAALDRFLVRWTGYSLTVRVFAYKNGFRPGPALFLKTMGRKSGKTHGVALPYFEIDGKMLIVGSRDGVPNIQPGR
jgi:F420H(2)-dependent quinone reductase